jgi:hypothetical protein
MRNETIDKGRFEFWAWESGKPYPKGGWTFETLADALRCSMRDQFGGDRCAYEIREQTEAGFSVYGKRKIKTMRRRLETAEKGVTR